MMGEVFKAVTGSLGLISVGGLSVVALGLVPWGIRAVALFTLLGLAWLLCVILSVSVGMVSRERPGGWFSNPDENPDAD